MELQVTIKKFYCAAPVINDNGVCINEVAKMIKYEGFRMKLPQ